MCFLFIFVIGISRTPTKLNHLGVFKTAAKIFRAFFDNSLALKRFFGPDDKTCTWSLYYPNGDLNIFIVVLSFFRHFRYGKNDRSRSRGILSPGTPIVSMVAYVVVKIRSQIDGFGLMGADDFL